MSRVLLVDDDEVIARITKFFLKASGYECLAALNGLEGLKLAFEEKPDLILLDVMMPIMNGIEVLKKIRESSALRETPVIMFTAMSDTVNVKSILKLGVTDYIVKPLNKDLLIKKVKKIIGEPDKIASFTQKGDFIVFDVHQDQAKRRISDVLFDTFTQMTDLISQGNRKFIIDFGGRKKLDTADLGRIGDGIGEANGKGVELKFVVTSRKIKEQFLNFYETKDAAIYSSYEEASKASKEEKVFSTIERDGIVVLTNNNDRIALLDVVNEMFESIFSAGAEGKKRFILSFEGSGNLDKLHHTTRSLIAKSFFEAKRKGIEIKFVIPSKIAKDRFQNFGETMEIFSSEYEAIQKIKRDMGFSLTEKEDIVVIKMLEKRAPNSIWGILKDVFREIFELASKGKKKFIISFADLGSLDVNTLNLLEGAMSNAKANEMDIKFVTISAIIKDQFESTQSTKDLELYSNIEEALQQYK